MDGLILVTIFFWLFLSFAVGMASSAKKVGFWAVFLISLIFSPLIGLIVGLASSKKEPQQVRMVNASSGSTADELLKLRALADKKIITEEEFEVQKKKLLNT